jgi:hypothetical protein
MEIKMHKFYSDNGHGWLSVKRQKLIDLGILEKISSYSYQKGQTVYLEEDCDAALYMDAYKEKFGILPEYNEIIIDVLSPIRSYEHFELVITGENIQYS